MSGNPAPPLRVVLARRQKQIGFRLGLAAAIAACYGPLVGWPFATWFALYASAQAVEYLAFAGPRPLVPVLDRVGRLSAYAIMAFNNMIFASMAVVDVARLGSWGVAFAAYLIAGGMMNSVLTTMEDRGAFLSTVLPFALVNFSLPLLVWALPDHPSLYLVIGISGAGALQAGGAMRLWSAWSAAKMAEAAAVARDLAEREANEERLFRMAHTDILTGLANRTVLQAHLSALRAGHVEATLLLIDLDGFKYVNDTQGHSAGDDVLREVAARLTLSARPSDLIVRLGGDEFALLVPGLNESGRAQTLADRIIASVSQPLIVAGSAVHVGASVGIALFPADGADGETLLASADLALYQAKGEGRHCSRLFTPALRDSAQTKISRDAELARALEKGELELFYQPQINLYDHTLNGAEALLRWRHPERGLLAPVEFLAAIESGAMAAQVGEWVLHAACAQAAAWRREHPTFRVGVNLFGAQFRSGDLASKVTGVLFAYDLPPDALELEITENIILRHEDSLAEPLKRLREIGVSIAFDDYGTGFASLSLLKRYPLSRLKIDMSFVQAVCNSPADATIVRAVISMAEAFTLGVIAEGVQTKMQAERLRQYGCEEAQGHYYGQPQPAAEFERRFLAAPKDCTSDRKVLGMSI